MKSFLLCIGLTLLLARTAHAQDSIKTPFSDTAISSAQVPIIDSLKDSLTGQRLADSTRLPNVDSNHTDSIRRRYKKSGSDTLRPNTAADSINNAAGNKGFKNDDSSKIVDIFEEMKKAQILQDNSIKKEAETEKNGEKKTEKSPAAYFADTSANASLFQIQQNQVPAAASIADSSQLSTHSNLPKKDTIQSIFTLPAPDTPTHTTTNTTPITNPATDSAGVEGGQHSDDLAGSKKNADTSRPVTVTVTDSTKIVSGNSNKDKNKAAVKAHLDDLFAKTTAQSREDSIATMAAAQKLATETALNSTDPSKGVHPQGKNADSVSGSVTDTAMTMLTDSTQKPPINQQQQPVRAAVDGSDTNKLQRPADSTVLAQLKGDNFTGLDSVTPAQNTPFTELFQPYRTFDKETKIESTTSLTILQQNVDYKTSADFTTRYQRTGQTEGQFLFDVSVVRLNTQVETMGVQLKYDSNKRTDSTSTFAKPLFDIVGKRTYLQVDSTGRITRVDTTDLGRQVNSVLSGLSLSGGDFEIGSNFGLLLSKSGKVQVGQQWSDSISHQGNRRVTTYTIKNVLDGDLLVEISGTVSQSGDINSDGAVFKTHFTGTQKGKMYVDPETLLVKSREITLNMKGTVDYNDQSLPASAISKIKEKVTTN